MGEEKLTQARKLLEQERMKECTFQPRVTPAPKPKKKPVFVRGVRKFMARKKFADKLQEEEEKRKKKAFSVSKGILKKRRGGRYTLAEPFRLGKTNKKALPESREMEDCTFIPTTCSQRNKALVSEIIH